MFMVKFNEGVATEVCETKKGLQKRCYAIFLDSDGVYILTRKTKIYLNSLNSFFV